MLRIMKASCLNACKINRLNMSYMRVEDIHLRLQIIINGYIFEVF